MSPQSVMADFELAAIQSLKMQLPGIEIQGCYFHSSQCLWRKIQALGMADLYKSDADTRSFIHKAAALPFIPVRTWNCFNHNGPCTNNHVEGWHNRLKKMVRKAHPNLFEFIEVIQKEQAAAEVTAIRIERVRAKKRKVVRYEGTIKKLTEEFTGSVRTLESFLSSLSPCVVSFGY